MGTFASAASSPPIALLPSDSSLPYRPLVGTELRYITIQPFDESVNLVECEISQMPIEEVEYVGVSYSWGESSITETILVGGEPMQVTTNLAACLKRLASKPNDPNGAARNYWVDSICINQFDQQERSAQVLRMRDIFSSAKRVLVWLGEERPETGLAVDRINEVTQKFVEWGLIDGNHRGFLASDSLATPEKRFQLENKYLSEVLDAQEAAVRTETDDLLKRDWWRRTW